MTHTEVIEQLKAMLGYYLLSQPEIDAMEFAITALREQEAGKKAVAKTLRDLLVELKQANLEYRDVFSAGESRGYEQAIKTLARNWRNRKK